MRLFKKTVDPVHQKKKLEKIRKRIYSSAYHTEVSKKASMMSIEKAKEAGRVAGQKAIELWKAKLAS